MSFCKRFAIAMYNFVKALRVNGVLATNLHQVRAMHVLFPKPQLLGTGLSHALTLKLAGVL